MTLSERTLAYLIENANTSHSKMCSLVSQSARALDNGINTQNILNGFVQERAQARRQQVSTLVDVNTLRIVTGFSRKLERAVVSQEQLIAQQQESHADNLKRMVITNQRLKAMQFLKKTSLRARQRRENLAEQRLSDEFSARYQRFSRRRTTSSEGENS